MDERNHDRDAADKLPDAPKLTEGHELVSTIVSKRSDTGNARLPSYHFSITG